MFFRKKNYQHELFGNLVLTGGQWVGQVAFGPLKGHIVSIYLLGKDIPSDTKYSQIWGELSDNYFQIRDSFQSAILDFCAESEDPFLILGKDFNINDILLEGVTIEDDFSVALHWGVIPQGSLDFEVGVVTRYSDGRINILAVGD